MKVRFGYVAMSSLLYDASPSKTITFKNYSKLASADPEIALNKLRRITKNNLHNTLRILRHNQAYGVMVYRFSSKIIPLATHPKLNFWDYLEEMKQEFTAIGDFVKEYGMRVSFHPDHYTLLNSPREEIFETSLRDLLHHCNMLEKMKTDQAKLVIHVGGAYQNKQEAIERFCRNFERLPEKIKERLTLENDDTIFNAHDVLNLCQTLSLPMVLDIHHHRCNHEDPNIEEILGEIFATWAKSRLAPKIHVSSPRGDKDKKSHHDFVNHEDLYPFLLVARKYTEKLDVMVEAKQKDQAMFKLVRELALYPQVEMSGEALLHI